LLVNPKEEAEMKVLLCYLKEELGTESIEQEEVVSRLDEFDAVVVETDRLPLPGYKNVDRRCDIVVNSEDIAIRVEGRLSQHGFNPSRVDLGYYTAADKIVIRVYNYAGIIIAPFETMDVEIDVYSPHLEFPPDMLIDQVRG